MEEECDDDMHHNGICCLMALCQGDDGDCGVQGFMCMPFWRWPPQDLRLELLKTRWDTWLLSAYARHTAPLVLCKENRFLQVIKSPRFRGIVMEIIIQYQRWIWWHQLTNMRPMVSQCVVKKDHVGELDKDKSQD
jgi:hypothetical protein